MTTEAQAPSPLFKILLVAFPLGLVVLGAASFGVYFMRKDHAEQRSSRYAAAMRRELSEEALRRYEQVIATTVAQPQAAEALAAFILSSVGHENMGYSERILTSQARPTTTGSPQQRQIIDVEVTGTQRRREFIVLATDYPASSQLVPGLAAPVTGLPAWLSIAHACTGLAGQRTLSFVATPDLEGLRDWVFSCREKGIRLTHLHLLGSLAAHTDAEVHSLLGTGNEGVVLLRPTHRTLPEVQALKSSLLELTARP